MAHHALRVVMHFVRVSCNEISDPVRRVGYTNQGLSYQVFLLTRRKKTCELFVNISIIQLA